MLTKIEIRLATQLLHHVHYIRRGLSKIISFFFAVVVVVVCVKSKVKNIGSDTFRVNLPHFS